MNRREWVAIWSAAVLSGAPSSGQRLLLNEDANHFFMNRRKQRLTQEIIRSWVDQYAGTQVRELILNVNAMRTSFAAKSRESFWSGYDPKAGPKQKMFATLPAEAQVVWDEWIRCAWQMDQDGLDLYRIWIPEIRRRGMSPWVSMRMNDLHNVEDEEHPLHTTFWKANPQLRRVPYRGEQRDKALDYGRPEVRQYAFRLIEEICERYDFDTLELDWMRHGFHFRPGYEVEGARQLQEFHGEVRRLLDQWQKKRRHKIGIAVRVPSTPATAQKLGMDALSWADAGLIDLVTVTNYWRTVDNAMPVAEWRRLLPKRVQLAAGLELGLNAFINSVAANGKAYQSNSLETVRGSAAAYLARGADAIYLFNYMDSDTAMDDNRAYPTLLRECGEARTLLGKDRRHVVTYQDTWAPGEPVAHPLPAELKANQWRAFRVPTGPVEEGRRPVVRVGVAGEAGQFAARANGVLLEGARVRTDLRPGPATPVFEYAVPVEAWRALENVVEVAVNPSAKGPVRVEWVEFAVLGNA